MPEVVQEPIPLNPDQTRKDIAALIAEIDQMKCGDDARPLMDFVQDRLLPVIERMHEESTGTMFYVGQHEDRIQALEDEEESQLLPEDADQLMKYLVGSLEVLKRLSAAEKINIAKLITQGEKAIEFVKEITLDDDGAPDDRDDD